MLFICTTKICCDVLSIKLFLRLNVWLVNVYMEIVNDLRSSPWYGLVKTFFLFGCLTWVSWVWTSFANLAYFVCITHWVDCIAACLLWTNTSVCVLYDRRWPCGQKMERACGINCQTFSERKQRRTLNVYLYLTCIWLSAAFPEGEVLLIKSNWFKPLWV